MWKAVLRRIGHGATIHPKRRAVYMPSRDDRPWLDESNPA